MSGGTVGLDDQRMRCSVTGDANLGILQGFFRDIRSSGRADARGPRSTGRSSKPRVLGQRRITDGRIRHFSLPHSLEAINGRVTFDDDGIRLDGPDRPARRRQGPLRRPHRAHRLPLGELGVAATGENMRLRYPEGFRSLVDAAARAARADGGARRCAAR